MTIALYDIDLWHRGKAMPNLELMKVYNYYYQKGDKVIMMRPEDREGRFSKIIYFKDKANTEIPRKLSLTGKNKEIYGYGFFKVFTPLSEEFTDVPPSYLPYDAYSNKLHISNYDAMKRDSYIRIENNDFSDYKKDRTNIYIADHNIFYLDKTIDFLEEYKNHNFKPIHALEIKDEETFRKFYRYIDLFDRTYFINFNFSEDFFKEFINERIIYNWTIENEKEIKKKILMILGLKIRNISFSIKFLPKEDNLYKDILLWGRDKTQDSFYDYYKDNKSVMKKLDGAPTEIRLLLKCNPKKMRLEDITFDS